MLNTFQQIIIERNRCSIVVFQPSVVFHIEITDFTLESDKMFQRQFYRQEPKFKRKFQVILETVFCECFSLCPLSNGKGLTLIRVVFQQFALRLAGEGKTSCLTRVRIMLKTSNLARKCTHMFRFRKYTFITKVLLILVMLAFFCKKISVFLPK